MSAPDTTENIANRVRLGETAAERSARLAAGEISVIVLMLVSVVVSQAFPFRPVKLALAGILGASFLVQIARSPAMALAMLAFVTPAMDVMPISFFGIPGLNAETVLVLLALLIWARANQLHGKDHFGTPLGKILLVYALVIVATAFNAHLVWHDSLFDVLSSAKNHLSFMVFLPVAFHVARTRREQGLLVGAAALALLLSAVQAINHSWFAFFAGTLERHRAMALLALQPNTFGAALALYLPTVVLLAMNKVSNRLGQLFFVGLAFAMGFALLLTLSRGSWIGTVLGLGVVAMLADRRLLVLLCIAAASYTLWVPTAAIERVEETTQFDSDMADDQIADGSTMMRIEQYRSLSAMMAPRPVFGWGYASFPRVFEKYGTLQRAKGAHSSYVKIGVEGGVIGLVALGTVLLAVAWAGWTGYRRSDSFFVRMLGMGVLGGIVAMAVCMGSGARFEPQKIFVFFWLLVGIVQRETVRRKTDRLAAVRAHSGRETDESGQGAATSAAAGGPPA